MSLLYTTLTITTVLRVTSGNVYNVTPDNFKCDHCLNLQHYLLNAHKYFVSNTQLRFLPGLYYLPNDLNIQNVHNISLIGSTVNGTTPDTVIQCNSSVGIVMTNITNLTVWNMVIRNCKNEQLHTRVSVFIKECHFVRLHSVHIYHGRGVISLVGVNILGYSYLHEIKCQEIHFYYNETIVKAKKHKILINNFYATNNFASEYGIYLNMSQYSYEITLQVVNSTIQQLRRSFFLLAVSNSIANHNMVLITKCQFHDNNYKTIWCLLYLHNISAIFSECQFIYNRNRKCRALVKIDHGNNATFFRCKFEHNGVFQLLREIILVDITYILNITIKQCYFYDNKHKVLNTLNSAMLIKNATFSSSVTMFKPTIQVINGSLLLSGPVIFRENRNIDSVVALSEGKVTLHGYVEFSNNYVKSIINFYCWSTSYCLIKMLDNTTVSITNNKIFTYFSEDVSIMQHMFIKSMHTYTYPQCFIQYFSAKNLDNDIDAGNFSIVFENNKFELNHFNMLIAEMFFSLIPKQEFGFLNHIKKLFVNTFTHVLFITITHCYWLPQSAFHATIPLNVNKHYMKHKNNSKPLFLGRTKILCHCTDEKQHDCFKNELDSLYPGQTLTIALYANVEITFNTTEIIVASDAYITPWPCTVLNAKENFQLIGKNCTTVKYTITFPNNNWCELSLKMLRMQSFYDTYYIKELQCPLGFVKIDGICQCYSSFKQFGFTDCDINTQTILRPNNGWLLFDAHHQPNDSYSCYISQQCPFDYCKSSSFYLNLSTPDSQCQFNRSGILCGQCQQGLSTVFGSSHCQHCSNIYLLIIIPIAVAGFVLVLLLFLLNLTVTDGTINAFILYVNIIGINDKMFFPEHHTITPLHTFISLANLDLGIKICFYNGMDDYAGMWLQLTFPLYIICIAALIIIVKRYSIIVQRLTFHRDISVLATLFLLSFTKILHTTSRVLFLYSSITHLPSEHTTLVWSVDANVPLFGVKFTLLFVTCLVLFSILLLYTIVLLFTKVFLKVKIFNSILDNYQRPYKIHYWFGLQLVMRMIFLYVSFLDREVNITTGIVILNIAIAIQGIKKPFKSNFKNCHELLLITNLFGLYMSLSSGLWIVIYVLISVAITQFSLIVICCIITKFCNRAI